MSLSIKFSPNYNLKHDQFNKNCIACHAVQRCNKYHYSNSVHEVFQKNVIGIMGAGAKSIKENMCQYYPAKDLSVEQAAVLKIILSEDLHLNVDLEFSFGCLNKPQPEAIFSLRPESLKSFDLMEISPRTMEESEEEDTFIAI